MANNSAQLTIHNLVDEDTGETNTTVLKALARRRAMADYGAITPRSLRSALQYYAGLLPEKQCAWRMRHGLPVAMTTTTAYGKQRDGVRRSAF
jgi:hypothetical protein